MRPKMQGVTLTLHSSESDTPTTAKCEAMPQGPLIATESSKAQAGTTKVDGVAGDDATRSAVRPSGEGGEHRLERLSDRDIAAALQLLVERARDITGADGAAFARREQDRMVCRASTGPSSPELLAQLEKESGLCAESVRTRQVVRFDRAESDSRVDREHHGASELASALAIPVAVHKEVIGALAIFRLQRGGFQEADVIAVQRLAEMIAVALELEPASTTVEKCKSSAAQSLEQVEVVQSAANAGSESAAAGCTSAGRKDVEPSDLLDPRAASVVSASENAANADTADVLSAPVLIAEAGSICKCKSCGFPISGGRALCVDCEAKGKAAGGATADTVSDPDCHQDTGDEESWLMSHRYLVAAVITLLLLIGLIYLR